MLGQQVQMVFLDLPVLLPQIKTGALRPIAIGARERAPTAMEVPTTAEVGMPDLLIQNWYGMVAPAGTPPDIVAALNRIATEAMGDPAVKEKLASQGATAGRRHAGTFPRLYRSRNDQVGESDQGLRHSDREVIRELPHEIASALRRLAQMLHQLLRRPRQRPGNCARRSQAGGWPRGRESAPRLIGNRPGAASGRDFRHHRNADARRHHLADRIEMLQPRAKAQARAEPRGVAGDMRVQRARRRSGR